MLVATLLAAAVMGSAEIPARPELWVHVMPWFERTETILGYHWKMALDPEALLAEGRVASHYRPLIGAYDSLDPDVIELQVGWMKVAGFEGVLADWYGILPHWDYPRVHTRTQALVEVATEAGLGICEVFEDQTAKHLVNAGLLLTEEVLPNARATGEFLAREWVRQPNWLSLGGRPAVFVFGPQKYGDAEWAAFREGLGEFALLTLHRQEPYAQGGFDWPVPGQGMEFTWGWPERSRGWGLRVPVAFPRFHDYYPEGGESGYPELPDRDGATYRDTLDAALAGRPELVQVATWNDWQEGTQIEPSVEFGMRDLVATQAARRSVDPDFGFGEADLDLPLRLYRLRKSGTPPEALRPVRGAIFSGDVKQAATLLDALER